VFKKDASGNWVQDAYLKASNADANDNFGLSVSISNDTVVVGTGLDAAYIFTTK
jgi:trimeric autotransporter adhesin